MNAPDRFRPALDEETTARLRASMACAPVSVVVPCYRCAATLDDAVASVAAQTLRPAEVLLVDDASGDDTLARMHALAEAYGGDWIRVIPLSTNGGPSRARNVGWDQSRQPYVAFLDADDCWGPHKLELQMAAIAEDPSIALIAHEMQVRPRGTQVPVPQQPANARVVGRRTLLVRNPFPTASVVLRRDLPFRFDENFRHSEDYLLWSKILLSGYRCARIDQVLAIWNKRERGASGLSDDVQAVHRARRDMRRKLLRQGLLSRREYMFASTVGMVNWLRRGLLHSLRQRGLYRPHG